MTRNDITEDGKQWKHAANEWASAALEVLETLESDASKNQPKVINVGILTTQSGAMREIMAALNLPKDTVGFTLKPQTRRLGCHA